MSPRILLVDTDPLLFDAVFHILKWTEFAVVGLLPDGASVLQGVHALKPDLVLSEILLHDMTGFEMARQLRHRGCKAKIVILTMHETAEFVSAAFDLGVRGYVFKSRIDTDLLEAIEAVLAGGHFIPVPSTSSGQF
jgi:two-component system, NarL family, nitrate/nitrite response regulator NarL